MGLDIVEMVMATEEEFSIELPDEELEKIRTVGELYELVLLKLGDRVQEFEIPDDECQSAIAFYELRKIAVDKGGVKREDVRPDTKLEDIFKNKKALSSVWKEWLINLRDKHHHFIRDLEVRGPYKAVAALSAIVSFIGLCYFSYVVIPDMGAGLLLAYIGLSFGLMFYMYSLFYKYAGLIPEGYSVLRDVLKNMPSGFTDEEKNIIKYLGVWGTYKLIVSDQLGVNMGEVTYNARFVDDLGAD